MNKNKNSSLIKSNTENTKIGNNKHLTKLDIPENEYLLIKNTKVPSKQIEIISLKTLPILFFIIFLMIFCLILIKFVPNFFLTANTKHLYLIKHSFKYFSEYFSDQNTFIKVIYYK